MDALTSEGALHAVAVPPQWQETIVDGAGGDGGGDSALLESGVIRFQLPADATAASAQVLMRACSEVQRAGGGAIARPALGGFTYDLLVRCCMLCRSWCDAPAQVTL